MTPALRKSLIPAAVLGLVLTGCAAGGGDTNDPTEGPSEAADTTLSINWGGFPQTWAPGSQAMEPGTMRIPYETLLQRDPDGTIKPNLATEWSFGEGAKSLSLTVRDDVVFHDGTPLDAEAVKTNIEYVKDVVGGQFGGPLKSGIESIDVTGEYSLTINFTRPYGTFTTLLSQRNLPMASPAAIADGSIETTPVGTSPWAYDESASISGTMMAFTKFDDYWGDEMPAMENIHLYAIPDDTAAAAAVASGEIDVSDVESEQIARLDDASNVDWYQYGAIRNNVTFFDRGPDGLFGDERVRQALCYSLDTTVYTSLDITGHAVTQHFQEGEPGHNPAITGYEPDLDKAKALMAEAGNPAIKATFPAAPFNRQQVEIYAEAFNQLDNVDITVQELAPPDFIATWASGQFPLGIGNHPQITPQDWYGAWWSDTAGNNPSKWASDELKALAGQAQAAGGSPEAADLWADVMKEISDEALNCGNTVTDQIIAFNTDQVANVQQAPFVWEANLIDYWAVTPARS